jgi:hypothetical protein
LKEWRGINGVQTMAERLDPFIRNLHKMCRKDDIATQQLIAGTISWADVPSDDDILELEGWRAYAEIQNRAKSAYHRTVRIQKHPVQRLTVKHPQPKPMERKPYLIMKQEQTKNIVENGRITPVKEIVDVVVQPPMEYHETDIEFITTQAIIESQMEKPVEIQVETKVETPVETHVEIEEIEIIAPVKTTQLTKRHSKEKLKRKKQVTPVIYQPTFTQLYILPLLPFIMLLLLLVIVCTMKL